MDGGEDFARSSLVENEGIDLNASCETKITHLEVSHVIFCLLLLSLFENILSRDRTFGSVVQLGVGSNHRFLPNQNRTNFEI